MPFSHIYINIFLQLQGSIQCSTEYASILGGIECNSRLVSGKCYITRFPIDFKHCKRTDILDKAVFVLVIDLNIDL